MKKIILLILASLTFLAAEDVKIKSAGTDADDGVVFKNSIDLTLVDIDGTGVVNIKGIPSAGATLRLFEAFGNGSNYLQLNPGVSLGENATWNLSHAGGSGNMFLGYESGSAVLSSGAANVGLGYNAAKALTSGVRNVALGYKALTAGTSANYNITIGYQAGDVLTTGQKNIIIGSDADPSAASGENQVVIGYEAVGTADNQVVLGNSSTTQWIPGSADATDLGSASAEFNDLYLGDGAVVNLGVDQDVSLTHIADTGVRLSGSSQLQFRDAALNVSSSADGQLDVDADTELELVAPIVDIDASTEVNISGEMKIGGKVTTGSEGAGVDVVLYSNTSGDDFTWDASEEKLIITGTNGQDALTITDGNITVVDNVTAAAFIGDGSALDNVSVSNINGALTVAGSENSSGSLHIYADEGDDDNDKWRLETANGGSMTIDSKQSESWSTLVTLGNTGVLTVTGAVAATTLTGDGSGITGVSASSIKANDVSAGDAAVTISTTFGAVNITPASGSAIVLDGTINVDAGVITGATSVTASGAVTGGSLTDGTATITSGAASGLTTVTASGAVTGGSLTDGTATITSGAASGLTTVTASGAVTGGSLTDGTATISSGAVSGVASLAVDNVKIDGTTIGHTDDTDLMTLTSGTVTVAGTVAATTLTGDGSGITGVSASAIKADDVSTGDAAVTIATSSGAVTLDSPADVVLDADGADVWLADGGTNFGSLSNSSGELVVKSGSTPTTALTFSGANVTTSGNLLVGGAITTAGNATVTEILTVKVPSGDLTVTGNDITFGNGESISNGTDGTVAITATTTTTSGALTATGAVTGGSLTDGTATISSGAVSGVASLAVDNVKIDGTTIGHTDDTDLMTLTSGILTVAGTVAATTLTGDGSGITGVSATSIGTLAGASPLVLEGATADDYETTITVTDPTADRILTLPNATSTLATTTGTETFTNKTLTSPDINGGTVDGAAIGASSASTGAFTTASASTAIQTPLIEYTDGDDAITIADGGAITTAANATVTGDLTVTGNDITFGNGESISNGTDGTVLVTAPTTTLSGDLTVTGDDLTMATNTSGAALIGDGTNFNPVVISGDISIGATGTAAIGTGVIVNADISSSAAIADSKLATISTADKVSGAAVQVDGATDGSGITLADADKFIIDDGGTTKYITASQLNTYTSSGLAADDISTGNAAVTISTSSGAVTLDSPADVVLDADGADVKFKDGGTLIGTFTNSSSDFVITANVSDKDMIFKGNDGGTTVTALTFDMSNEGSATFNDNITAQNIYATGTITASENLGVKNGSTSGGAVAFYEDSDNGSNYTALMGASSISSDVVWVLPSADGSSGQFMSTNGSGTLSWGSASSTVNTLSDALIEDNSLYLGNDPSSNSGFDDAQYNLAVGTTALDAVTTGDKNVGVGYNALTSLNTGSWNSAVGGYAASSLTSGSDNVAFGLQALENLSGGSRNIAIGNLSMDGSAGSENDNLAVGYGALGGSISGGEFNVAIGNYALDANTSGDDNTGIGYNAMTALTTGDGNVSLGRASGTTITTGSNNTVIGKGSDVSASGAENQVVIGQGATGQADNSVVLGNASVTAVYMSQDKGATAYGATFEASTGIIPDAADGAYLGTTSAEFSDLFLADGSVINLGNDQDVTLTHVADTGVLLNSSRQLQFRDSALGINSSADGQLDIDADTEVEITTTTVDLNGALDVSGTSTLAGAVASGAITSSGIIKTDDATEATSTTDGSLQTDGGLSVAKDAVIGDDLKLLSDSAVLGFGADSDVKITHDPDDGLFLKSAATADDNPFLLTLQTGETAIEGSDVLGVINFQAPDEADGNNALLIGAVIEAVAEYDFTVTENHTKLVFKTASDAAAAERLSIASSGWATFSSGATFGGDLTVTGNDITFGNSESISNSTNGTVKINGEVAAGTGSAAGVFKSNGNYDATLKTGNSTTGSITITDGSNGDITIAPNGTGETDFDGNPIANFSASTVSITSATTLATSHNGKVLICNNSSDFSLTIPEDTLPVGFNCLVVQKGAGEITLAAASGNVTINNRNSHTKTANTWAIMTLICIDATTDANVFVSSGDGTS